MIYINIFLTFYTIPVGFIRSRMFCCMFKNRPNPGSISLTMGLDSMLREQQQQQQQQQEAM